MDNNLSSLYVKPREWQEWVIGTFDPTFKEPARFFAGWDTNDDKAIMALLVQQEHGYDTARRMPKDEAENEMLLLQSCVGPDVYIYKIPYLAPAPAKSLDDITRKAKRNKPDLYQQLKVKDTITKHTKLVDNFDAVLLGCIFATFIAAMVFL